MNEEQIAYVLRETNPGSGERVLVAVMNNPRDLEIARRQGWYRIPVKRAPRRVGADYLAFYFTAKFPPQQRHRVLWYAPIRAYHLVQRLALLPDEPAHPRAADPYFKIEIGSLQQLAHPIPSRKLRRITFIPTTLEKLLAAREINDLWDKGRHQDALWAALQADDIVAERQIPIKEQGVSFVADFVIPTPRGSVIVRCDERHQENHTERPVLSFTAQQLLHETAACMQQIKTAMQKTT